jgi:hypothetical protein
MRCALFTTILAALFVAPSALAQPKQPDRPAAAPPAGRPYNPVAITLPAPMQDKSFDAFRGQLGEIAKRKDRAALGKLVVGKGFFWQRGRADRADKKKSGLDNLAVALGLNNSEGAGWDMLAGYAEDPTTSPAPLRGQTACAPADPAFDSKALDALLEATKTDVSEWGFPVQAGIDVRATPSSAAAVIDRLGLHFVRVMADNGPGPAVPSYLHVATPAGKTGYIPSDVLAPIGNDQLCYVKDGEGWKITGYIGAGDAQ